MFNAHAVIVQIDVGCANRTYIYYFTCTLFVVVLV